MSDWTKKLKTELGRDWRRTGLLLGLIAVGMVVAVRQFSGSPEKAGAATPPKKQSSTAHAAAPAAPIGPAAQAAVDARKPSLRADKVFRFNADVSTMTLPRHDPFKVKLDVFPPDPSLAKAERDVKVSMPADAETERQRRLAQQAIVRAEAQKLRLQSVMITDPPRAMIGGDIYRVGQAVGPFVLTRIGGNSVTLEKDGFEVMLKME